MKLNSVREAVEAIRAGGIAVVIDDMDREHEGDLIAAAELASPEVINFMVTHGRGLVCVPLERSIVEELNLPAMTRKNRDPMGTAFTISVDHRDTTTGISAYERALSIQRLGAEDAREDEFNSPGHVFPLIAADGGVISRPGHTEAAVDLAQAAGLRPAGVICEILKEDGTMARTDDLIEFAQTHRLPVITIAQLIQWRKDENRERFVLDSTVSLPTQYGEFTLHTYVHQESGEHHLALVMGDISSDEHSKPPLVRVHSECLTGDVLHSLRCDCGQQLDASLERIAAEGRGAVIYLRQEGRGIGLVNKMRAYRLQEQGYDTVQANIELGFAADERNYEVAATILSDLGVKQVRLLTNNPDKVNGLENSGITVAERLAIVTALYDSNRTYMQVKSTKMGHLYQVESHELKAI
ncbi:MAG: GTP cyclohydrolase II [Sphaerochaetaceae bacterium]|nr:GTP cyclohydrolase II [Sphaerochaetaceae bacterium]